MWHLFDLVDGKIQDIKRPVSCHFLDSLSTQRHIAVSDNVKKYTNQHTVLSQNTFEFQLITQIFSAGCGWPQLHPAHFSFLTYSHLCITVIFTSNIVFLMNSICLLDGWRHIIKPTEAQRSRPGQRLSLNEPHQITLKLHVDMRVTEQNRKAATGYYRALYLWGGGQGLLLAFVSFQSQVMFSLIKKVLIKLCLQYHFLFFHFPSLRDTSCLLRCPHICY